MKELIKKNEGITLIALIITIIILVILTAVTINNVIGSNLIGFATKAAEDYIDAGEEENKVIQKTMALSAGKATAEDSKVQPGEEVTAETEKQTEGEITYNYTDVMGRHAMVPEGFKVSTKVSEQFIEDGLVIQDEEGNEFVWVPCYVDTKPTGVDEDVQKYEKHTYAGIETKADDKVAVEDTGKGNWKTHYYTMFGSHWEDTAAEDYGKTSIQKYGGFYIGRYEAGWPDSDTSKFVGDTVPYVTNKDAEILKKNISEGKKPVSKANVFSWNFINQKNAQILASNMYKEAEIEGQVNSYLVDGTAWDTIMNWIATDVDVNDSASYGNYCTTGTNYTGWYAVHRSGGNPNSCAENFKYGSIQLRSDLGTRIEIPTGSYNSFKLKNIYDLAGNMFERTTEVNYHTRSGTIETETINDQPQYAVCRGGSFWNDAESYPVNVRVGDIETDDKDVPENVAVGFRVVLYIK